MAIPAESLSADQLYTIEGGTQGGGAGGGGWIGPVIQATASLINEAANRKAAKKENAKARAFSQSESELAYQRDQDMWHMQNAYNSPREQMERLKAAGLNPNLVYGATAPGNQSGSAPTYTPAQGKFGLPKFSIPDMLSMYQGFQMRQAQIENVKAGTQNTEAATDNLNARTAAEGYQLGYRQQSDPHQLDILTNKKEMSRLEIQKMLQSIRNMSQQEQNALMDQMIKEKTLKQQDLDYEIRQEERTSKENLNMLRKYGANENDPLLLRILLRMMENSQLDFGF